ncbi:MAG: hypothetical protein K2G17_04265 [Duncaniella sp.]|nr:hypothetical protein [Duncaniella sp.]
MKKTGNTGNRRKETAPTRLEAVMKVSKKFYSDIQVRIADAINAVGASAEEHAEAVGAVDIYLGMGIEPSLNSLTVRLIFAMLKPEIDRAIERSFKARERARKRKEKSAGGRSEDAEGESEHENVEVQKEDIEKIMTTALREVTGDEDVAFRMNRRQRRMFEKLRRRENKKS